MPDRVKCKRCHSSVHPKETQDGICIDCLLQEGRNQVLYIMLCIGDENVAHENWEPERAQILYEARKEIVQRLRRGTPDGVTVMPFPREWPDFEKYTYTSG